MAESRGHPETIGERIKRLRLEKGLSQRELGCPGVSYAYISRIEAGTRQPSTKALRKIAPKLGASVEYLETGFTLPETERRELRLAEAELDLRLGDASGAERELRALADEALAVGDAPVASRARLALALAADERGDHIAAVELFEEAFSIERPSPLDRLDVFATLGRAYGAIGKSDSEIVLYKQCLAELEELPEAGSTQTRYRILLSYALSDTGDLGQAENALRTALEEAARDDDPYMRIRVFWSMARLSEMEGKSPAALRYASRAIALLDATEDHVHRARAHLLAAWIMNSAGDADGARGQLDFAESLFTDAASSDDLARLKVERARHAALTGDGEAAKHYATAAIELLHGEHDPILGTALVALGEGHAMSGEIADANSAFRRGVDLLERMHRSREALLAARLWAKLLRGNGREQEALAVLERATELAVRAQPQQRDQLSSSAG